MRRTIDREQQFSDRHVREQKAAVIFAQIVHRVLLPARYFFLSHRTPALTALLLIYAYLFVL